MTNKYSEMYEILQEGQRNLLVNFTILKPRSILWRTMSGIWDNKMKTLLQFHLLLIDGLTLVSYCNNQCFMYWTVINFRLVLFNLTSSL